MEDILEMDAKIRSDLSQSHGISEDLITSVLEVKHFLTNNRTTSSSSLYDFYLTKFSKNMDPAPIVAILEQCMHSTGACTGVSYVGFMECADKTVSMICDIIEKNTDLYAVEYLKNSSDLLDQYRKLLKEHHTIKVCGSSRDPVEEQIRMITSQYLDIARRFLPMDKIPKKDDMVSLTGCSCGSTEIKTNAGITVCAKCGANVETKKPESTYQDMERLSSSARYTYDPIVHFRKKLEKIQGLKPRGFTEDFFVRCKKYLVENQWILETDDIKNQKAMQSKLGKMTRNQVYVMLQMTDNSVYYPDRNYIHHWFTGQPLLSLSPTDEEMILEDYRKINAVFKAHKVSDERKKSIKSDFIIEKIFARRGIPYKKDDFLPIRSVEKIMQYRDLYDKYCSEIGL